MHLPQLYIFHIYYTSLVSDASSQPPFQWEQLLFSQYKNLHFPGQRIRPHLSSQAFKMANTKSYIRWHALKTTAVAFITGLIVGSVSLKLWDVPKSVTFLFLPLGLIWPNPEMIPQVMISYLKGGWFLWGPWDSERPLLWWIGWDWMEGCQCHPFSEPSWAVSICHENLEGVFALPE